MLRPHHYARAAPTMTTVWNRKYRRAKRNRLLRWITSGVVLLVLTIRQFFGSTASEYQPPTSSTILQEQATSSVLGQSTNKESSTTTVFQSAVTIPFTTNNLTRVPLSSNIENAYPFLQHGHDILRGNTTIAIPFQKEWLQSQNEDSRPYPVYESISSYQYCPIDEDINHLQRRRWRVWSDKSNNKQYFTEHGIWQQSINDKLGGHLFARAMGIPTPKIYFCTGDGPKALRTDFVPPPNNVGFVIKPFGGYAARGIFVLEHGFGSRNLLTNESNVTLDMVITKLKLLKIKNIYVEELILTPHGQVPDDYKIQMYNGVVGSIYAVRNRGTEKYCIANYNDQWERMDDFGCFFNTEDRDVGHPLSYKHKKQKQKAGIDKTEHYNEHPNGIRQSNESQCYRIDDGAAKRTMPFCSDSPQPTKFQQMIQMVQHLSRRIGIYMRIDVYENANGDTVLGEFTPWSGVGLFTCAALPSQNGRCIDSCVLGRMWKTGGSGSSSSSTNYIEGGPSPPVPPYLIGWDTLSMTEKCARVISFDPDQYIEDRDVYIKIE